MHTVQIKKLSFLLFWAAASLLVPLFSFTGQAAAATGYAFMNRYRIDYTYALSSGGPVKSDGGPRTATNSFLLTQSDGTDKWVYINEGTNDPAICNEFIEPVYTTGGGTNGAGITGLSGKYKLYTQPRVLGKCDPNNAGGAVVSTDIAVDTTKANYVLFKTDSNTITTMDGAYTWAKVLDASKVAAYPPAQEIYYETSNQISSSTCPSVIIKWNNTYNFGAPYVHTSNPNLVENGPASTYYRNMTADLTTTSPNNYAQCFADENLIGHLQSSLAKISGTGASYWGYETPKSTGFKPMGSDFVDINNFIGSQADLNNGISSASAGSSAIAGAAGSTTVGGSGTPGATSDTCPLNPGESLRWLGCSIFYTLQSAAQKVTSLLDAYLFTNPAMFNDTAQKAASVFRNIGMVLIVVAGLFMVISQALGFEFLDAYTVRKLMPRLGVALIGMAVSWPLLKFIVTLTNDLGGLIYSIFMLIPAAAGAAGSTADAGTGFGVAILSIVGVGASIFAIGMLASLSFIGTIILALLVAFIVLSIRQLVIFMVIILAPIAIAAYVIPGGQKLWDFWKNTLITTLLMYPLIMGFLGAGAATSYLIDNASLGAQSSILAILVYFAPFFMIPYAFKMAGGVMSTIFSMANDRNRGAFDRLKKVRQNAGAARMEHRKNRINRAVTERQVSLQRSLKARGNRSGTVGRFLANRGAGLLNGYQGNLEARMSAFQAGTSKELNDQIATGMDDEIRGLTVNKRAALASTLEAAARADGYRYGVDAHSGQELYRVGANGTRQFRTLGGAWVGETSVDQGHKRWGSDTHAQQTALSYEMRKANSEADVDSISSRYATLSSGAGGWGMSQTQAESAWIGSSFENQNQHIEFKKTNWESGELGSSGYQSLVDEVYEKKGSYPLSQMHSRTIERLKQADSDARQIIESGQVQGADGSLRAATAEDVATAQDRREKLRAIAETFMHDMGAGGGYVRDEAGQPVAAAEGGDGGRRIVSGQGAAHTNERVWELAEMTGARAAESAGTYAGPAIHTQVPTLNPRTGTQTIPNQHRQHGG